MEIGATSLDFLARKTATQLPATPDVTYQSPDSSSMMDMDTSHRWAEDHPTVQNDEDSGHELPGKKKKHGVKPSRALATFLTGGLSTLAMQPLFQSMMGRRLTPPPLSKLLTYALMGGGVATGVDALRDKIQSMMEGSGAEEAAPVQGGGTYMGAKMGWALDGFNKEAINLGNWTQGVMPGGLTGMMLTGAGKGLSLGGRAAMGAGKAALKSVQDLISPRNPTQFQVAGKENTGSVSKEIKNVLPKTGSWMTAGFGKEAINPAASQMAPQAIGMTPQAIGHRAAQSTGPGTWSQGIRNFGAGLSRGATTPWSQNIGPRTKVRRTGAGTAGVMAGRAVRAPFVAANATGGWLKNVAAPKAIDLIGRAGKALGAGGVLGGIGGTLGGGALGALLGGIPGAALGAGIGGSLGGLSGKFGPGMYQKSQQIGGTPSSTAGKAVSPLDKGKQDGFDMNTMMALSLLGGGGGGGISFGGGGHPMSNLIQMAMMNKMIGQMGGLQNIMGNIMGPQQGAQISTGGGAATGAPAQAPQFTVAPPTKQKTMNFPGATPISMSASPLANIGKPVGTP